MSNIAKWILAGVAFLVLAVFAVTLSDRSVEPERARERAPVEEPAPGESPDREPGNSPSTGNPEKQAYVDEVAPLIMGTADVMEKVSESLNNFADGKATNEEASADLKEYGDKLSSLKSDIDGLSPPGDLQKFQDLLVSGIGYFEKGAKKAASGIEASDPDQLEEAATLFEKGTTEINKANEEFDKNTKDLKTNKSYDFNI